MIKVTNIDSQMVIPYSPRMKKVDEAYIIVSQIYNDAPYYEIKYKEKGDNCYHIGYGSYDIEIVKNWLATEFEIDNDIRSEIKMSKAELFGKFLEMFPNWAKKSLSYKKIGSRAIAIRFLNENNDIVSRVFLYFDDDNWQFGTKLWRKVPDALLKKLNKSKEVENKEDESYEEN